VNLFLDNDVVLLHIKRLSRMTSPMHFSQFVICIICINIVTGIKSPIDPSVLELSGQAIVDQLLELATFTDDPNPAVTRILFTGNNTYKTTIGFKYARDAQGFVTIIEFRISLFLWACCFIIIFYLQCIFFTFRYRE